MKRVTRIILSMLLVLTLSTGLVLASTQQASAASKITIPNTSAKVDSRVVNAFKDLGFKVKYDKNLDYAGTFSVSKHSIILQKKSKNNTLHEMGHFLSRLKDGADSTKEFKNIYKAEKNKYSGRLKSYVKSNSKEYFAESFRQYTTWNSGLKKQRPKTYAYIKETIESISEDDVEAMYDAYGWAW